MSNTAKHYASAVLVLLALLAPLSAARGAVLTFDPMATINFDTMTAGHAISTLTPPWTSAGASSIVAVKPTDGAGNTSAMAITAPGTSALFALSPQQSMPAAFTGATTGDTLYFSAWVIHNGGGGNISLSSSGEMSGYKDVLGGFGIAGGAGRHFTYLAPNASGDLAYKNSTIIANRNDWYQMVLVIQLDTTNAGDSLGYLYYRNAKTDTEFTLLPEFANGLQMSWWTSAFNATDFAYYRLDNTRNNFQFDNFSAGMVIPEPSVTLLSGAALITLAFFAVRRRK